MSRRSRSSVFHPSEIAYVHTMLKVCRNLFLLGMDRKKRRKLLHRRQWFYQRMEHLCSYMAIERAYSDALKIVHFSGLRGRSLGSYFFLRNSLRARRLAA